MKWYVSAWTIWGLRAEWTLNMGTEASKGWLFCGDAARSRISQDRKNVLFEKLCILWFWIYLQDSGLVTTAGFALGGRWASSSTEGTTNVNWLKESSVEMEAARLWQFLRTGKICIYFENCSDCGLEKLQDLRCDCMLCAEIGSLASRGEALFDHEELAKCWRFKAWSSVDILTSLVCV